MVRKSRLSGIVTVALLLVTLSACNAGVLDPGVTDALSKATAGTFLVGELENITEASWTIDGQDVKLSGKTDLIGKFELGDEVKVDLEVDPDGVMTALQIELSHASSFDQGGEFEFYSIVKEINPDTWLVGGFEVIVTPQTEVKDAIIVGDFVKVHASNQTQGLVAREIELAFEDHSQDMENRNEIEFVGTVESINNGLWVVEGRELTILPQTEIKGLIEVGDPVKVHAYWGEGETLIAREIELPDMEHEKDDDQMDDDQHEVEFYGIVEAISSGEWLINGSAVLVTADTEIEGAIAVGDEVKVEAYENADGSLVAHEIELRDDSDDDFDSADDDDMDSDDDDDHDEDDDHDDHDEDHDKDDDHDDEDDDERDDD